MSERRPRAAPAIVVGLLAGALLACGSKSPLQVSPPSEDGGPAGLDAAPRDAGTDAGPEADECVELPFREPPRQIEVSFLTQILSADVYFLVDVTGSMGEEINEIRTELRETIVPGLATEIPDARFSVAHFADFPLPEHNYGEADDQLFRLSQPSTADLAAVQRAVDSLPLQGGRDGPESMVEALYLSATGEGMGEYAPPSECGADTVGYPCFRRTGSRVVLVFSDAATHNGPGGHDAYRDGTVRPRPHTYGETVEELSAIGAKVLGLYSGGAAGPGLEDLRSLARDTGAVRPDGTPLVFDIGREGELLGDSVVEAVRTLVDEVPIDVDVLVEDLPGDELDATLFVERVEAARAQPADGATNLGDRFAAVAPGTRLSFRVHLANDRIPQDETPHTFRMRVVLRGDGATRLQETVVQVVVPALGGGAVCP